MEDKRKMSTTRRVFIWIVFIIGIPSIGVLIYAFIISDSTLMQISGVLSIVMGVIRALIAVIPLDKKSKTEKLSPVLEIEATPADMPANNLPGKFHYFTGRVKVLTKIHQIFKPNSSSSPIHILIITGMGGIGKSEIAKAYAIRHRKDYDFIWWIDAETKEGVRAAYINFAQEYGLAKGTEDANDIIKEVKKWMRNHDRWLFIFDNAENETLIKEYSPDSNTGNILVTSRYTLWKEYEHFEIEILEEKEACDFLTKYTKQSNDAGVKELVGELGRLPLALKHAGAYMKTSKTSYTKYLELFRKNKTKYKDPAMQIVASTLYTSFERIQRKASRQLLYLCAFMAPKDINRQWFEDTSKKLPKSLRKVVKDGLMYNDIITELTTYSLVTTDYGEKLSIHRLVQKVIRDSLKKKQAKWRTYCINALNELRYFDFSTVESRELFRILAPHIFAVTNEISDEDATEETANLYHFLGYGYDELADYSQSLVWYEKALAIRKKVLGKEHPSTATTYNNMAGVYRNQGQYNKALEYYGKDLAISEKVLGKEHPNTATTYNNMAEVYRAQGQYNKALEYHKKSLDIKEKVLGKEHPSTANTYNNMAAVYDDQGDYDKALEYYEKALDIKEKVLGKEHPSTATTYNGMAVVYKNQGLYDLALEWYLKALPVLIRVLGFEHPNTNALLNNMFITYEASGKSEPFEEWLGKNLGLV